MGLMDVLNKMKHDPQGQPAPGVGSSSSSGMSPITMAILGLLAFKAMKSFGGGQASDASSDAGRPPSGGDTNVGTSEGSGGGLGDLLKGGLGGLLAGGAAGGILGGGLNDLIKRLQQHGLGDVANSWIGTGPNETVAPNDLAKALGADQINSMMAQSGLSRDQLLEGLSRHLPQVVDELTPEGRVPHHVPM